MLLEQNKIVRFKDHYYKKTVNISPLPKRLGVFPPTVVFFLAKAAENNWQHWRRFFARFSFHVKQSVTITFLPLLMVSAAL
jgi:hypothetical protein